MSNLGNVVVDGWTITRRNLIKMKRIPDVVIFSTIQPIMFVVLFVFVFGPSIKIPGVPFAEYVMAGIFAQTVVFGSALTGLGLAEDLQKGIIDRFRSLPMSRSAVLIGRTTSDLLNNVLVVIIMALCALAVGWRTHTSFLEIIGGFLLLLLFAYAFSWISATIGLSVRSPEVAQSAGFIWLFPMTFLSNAFVDTRQLNSFFKTVADWNPVSAVIAATRDLFGNNVELPTGANVDVAWSMEHPLATTLLWIVLLLVIFVPLSIRQYRKAANR